MLPSPELPCQHTDTDRHSTMISIELQRDVPQYMAIPWLITWVMALTVSVKKQGGEVQRQKCERCKQSGEWCSQ